MKKIFMLGVVFVWLNICQTTMAGTAFIPMWQHGLGVTYFNNIINVDTDSVDCTLKLFEIVGSLTYSTTSTVGPMDAWMSDTHKSDGWYQLVAFPGLIGFGWGMNECNGAPGTMYTWGAIYGTVSGKIVGITVLAPESGF